MTIHFLKVFPYLFSLILCHTIIGGHALLSMFSEGTTTYYMQRLPLSRFSPFDCGIYGANDSCSNIKLAYLGSNITHDVFETSGILKKDGKPFNYSFFTAIENDRSEREMYYTVLSPIIFSYKSVIVKITAKFIAGYIVRPNEKLPYLKYVSPVFIGTEEQCPDIGVIHDAYEALVNNLRFPLYPLEEVNQENCTKTPTRK